MTEENEEYGNEKINEEQPKEDRPWYEEAKDAPVASGQYLNIGNGFEYLLKFTDLESERQDQKVMKPSMRDPKVEKPKFWFYMHLNAIRGKKTTIDALIESEILTPEKAKRIKELEKNREYLLEIPPTARKALGKFISESGLKNDEAFSMIRTGSSGTTKYNFKKIGE